MIILAWAIEAVALVILNLFLFRISFIRTLAILAICGYLIYIGSICAFPMLIYNPDAINIVINGKVYNYNEAHLVKYVNEVVSYEGVYVLPILITLLFGDEALDFRNNGSIFKAKDHPFLGYVEIYEENLYWPEAITYFLLGVGITCLVQFVFYENLGWTGIYLGIGLIYPIWNILKILTGITKRAASRA